MNFTELLSRHNIPYRRGGEHHHVSQGWVGFDCPFCGRGTGRFHMGFSLAKRITSCWRCGYHPAARTLAELLGIRYHEARELIGSEPGWDLEYHGHKRGKLVLPWGLGPLLPAHVRYLRERGFDPEELQRLWGIQGIGIAHQLAWRIWIPVQLHGTVVSWTTRSLTDKGVRYIAAKQEEEVVPAKTLLFGEDYARHAIIVTEGPFDVFRIGPGAVATMGTAITNGQVERISKYPVRVICLDTDWAAQRRAGKLCRLLAPFPGRTVNVTLDAKDPGSASGREVQRLRRSFLE